MFDKRDYRIYNGIKREDVYKDVCNFWSNQGFYVAQSAPYQVNGQSYHQKIGLRREFYVRLDQRGDDTIVDMTFRAAVTDEGLIGGVAAAVLFFPAALVGGAISYGEYEDDAKDLMGRFWQYLDQVTGKSGASTTATQPQTPPPAQPSQDIVTCLGCGAMMAQEWKACPFCTKKRKKEKKKK